ncbi:hypothetical protein KFV05_08030 [Macrococcoides canis]|uniref:hypothetical protein n=1 Tax=Macrococcoides canis TaxID=1855823 RepID=UPI0020B68EF8|nr:hypothetical protein [Macrococcus canis]UTH01666.1 hypothetical protein KFV05_08030 [Macrococcus canis]
MKYKSFASITIASALLLGACGNNEEKEVKKSEVKKEKPTSEKPTTEKPTTEKPTTEKPTTEAPTTEVPTMEAPTTEVPVSANINNVTSKAQLESILYNNNISEIDKIAAYNSAVRNGVIPQGNVMEGPAIAAYQSSLRIESGAERSVYETNTQSNNEVQTNEPVTSQQPVSSTEESSQNTYPYATGEYDTNSPTYEEDENGNWVEVTE